MILTTRDLVNVQMVGIIRYTLIAPTNSQTILKNQLNDACFFYIHYERVVKPSDF